MTIGKLDLKLFICPEVLNEETTLDLSSYSPFVSGPSKIQGSIGLSFQMVSIS